MKRKKLESSNDTSPSTSEARPKRRRNDTTLVDTIQYIFDCLRNQLKENEEIYLCESFLRVPRKKTEPQYFEVVKDPIDMLKIQQKIKTDQYNDLEEFCADVELMVDNAKLYYAKSTEEYKDACSLWTLFEESKFKAPEEVKEKQRQKLLDDEEKSARKRGRGAGGGIKGGTLVHEASSSPMDSQSAVKELFGTVVTARERDAENRLLSICFRILPSEQRYPEYYQVIQNPIDLRTIASNICEDKYDDLDAIVEDFDLLFGNACIFNEPGSLIFKDAVRLKKMVHSRKQDLIDVILNGRGKLRCLKPVDGGEWHLLMRDMDENTLLPLPETDTSDEMQNTSVIDTLDDDADDADVDGDDPYWHVFLTAKALTVPSNPNYRIIEPFLRLPSKRWHADYYNEIRHPISMCQIRNKIKKLEYEGLDDLMADFDLMLNNAQQYNIPDSQIHRDAITIQTTLRNLLIQMKRDKPHLAIVQQATTPKPVNKPLRQLQQGSWDSDSEGEEKTAAKKRMSIVGHLGFKRRARLLFKTLMDFMTEDGRQPIVAFIEKPSRRDYPDYYQVIEHPIDMETIETRIKSDFYACEKELLGDFRMMLNNCMTYNEEGSVIHNDAQTLHKVLSDKVKELNSSETPAAAPMLAQSNKVLQLKKSKVPPPAGTMRNVKLIYNAVREFKDANNRQISDIFMKLPARTIYPDYYELIKSPIDLERILYKWKTGMYNSVDDSIVDFTLMCNNACRYNEPESQIYRDALTLHQVVLQKRLELVWQDSKVPRVKSLVQELLMSLFITVFNYSEDGRYTAESFSDLPSQDPVTYDATGSAIPGKSKPLTFDGIKRRLDKGLYTRLDNFQEDLFSIFTRARKLSTTSSRVYNDSITLQKAYMEARDKVCGSGRILKSSALKYTLTDLEADVSADRSNRPEEEIDNRMEEEPSQKKDDFVKYNEVDYAVGDFIYVPPTDPSLPKRIIHIQRIFNQASKGKGHKGVQMMFGFHYFRPEDTFHNATRKFYPKEVFKTEKYLTFPITDILGKCLVLSLSDFIRLKTVDIPEEDIFVCETRYLARSRFFKKIKQMPFEPPVNIKFQERDEPLVLTRVDSIFKERMDKHKEELGEGEDETFVHRSPLPNVARTSTNGSGELEFEQYNLGSGTVIKLGDFVYVKMPPIVVEGVNSTSTVNIKAIRHVTRIWLNPQGVCSFIGSVYSTAQELYMSGVQLDRMVAYKQEVYLTSVQDSLPLTDIIGKCSVLHVKEYALCRMTEIAEKDVYLCQNYFDEATRRISPLQSGIAKFMLSRQVLMDEIYYFSTAVNLQKAVLETINLAQLPRRQLPPQINSTGGLDEDLSADLVGEDSMDSSAAASLTSSSTPPPSQLNANSSPSVQLTKSSKKGRKQVSGYLLFSSEIRKSITLRNPSANFGEISRLVGMEWKKLADPERKAFEDRAQAINQENAEKALTTVENPASHEMPMPTSPDIVFECMWADCDYMFEDLADVFDHLLNDQNGHLTKVGSIYECSWRSCSRSKKNNIVPFPSLSRLSRHMKEVHLIKNPGRIVQHKDRSRNFVPSSRNSAVAPPNPSTLPGFTKAGFQVSVLPSAGNSSQQAGSAPASSTGLASLLQKQPEAIFAATPAKTQRLLHSEAYIKYIENLDKPYQSNWEKHMTATIDNTTINDSNRLPVNWLPDQYNESSKKDALQALWALRNFMMKDALCG